MSQTSQNIFSESPFGRGSVGTIPGKPFVGTRVRMILILLFVLFMQIALVGCDNDIAPFTDAGEFSYSITGYLDTAADTQYVRISALRQTVDSPVGPLNATVSTRAMNAQETIFWEDSVYVSESGKDVQLFFAPFRPNPGETYELSVIGPAGQFSRASTTVPINPGIELSEPVEDQATGLLTQNVAQDDVGRTPRFLRLAYQTKKGANGQIGFYTINYPRLGIVTGGRWEAIVNLERDASEVRRQLSATVEDTVFLYSITLHLERLDARWSIQGFEPFPDSNVENGDGFFGSVGRYSYEWTLEPGYVESLGFLAGSTYPAF